MFIPSCGAAGACPTLPACDAAGVCMAAVGAHERVPPSRNSRKVRAHAFQNYQGWRDEPLQDWREVNERVGEIGGWRTYLRESQQDGDGSDSGQGRHDHQGH
jgi:hypothetical protein